MTAFITAIGTSVPPNRLSQQSIASFMLEHLNLSDQQRKLVNVVYRASGIRFRHSVISDFSRSKEVFSFFPKSDDLEPFPTVGARMKLFKKEAINLSENAAKNCLGDTSPREITHLITVSCTGMYAPGIDIELIERLGMRTDIERTSINFMGCYAAFNALKSANHILKGEPTAKVLIVAVELCSIHLLKSTSEDSLLSNALFGDGAAAVLVQGEPTAAGQLGMAAFYSDLALEGKEEMAWHISDFAFEMKLSPQVPEVIQKGIGQLTSRLLRVLSLNVTDVKHFAIHPGGKKIVEVIAAELKLEKDQYEASLEVLKNYGNMSSPTVLFVMKHLMDQFTEANSGQKMLSFAFGPGLTMESMLLNVS